jgi:Protein of unknown function (DUF1264)
VRQCLIFDQPSNPAKLIGVDYVITRKLYETLDLEERKLWHSHKYEVSSSPSPAVFTSATSTILVGFSGRSCIISNSRLSKCSFVWPVTYVCSFVLYLSSLYPMAIVLRLLLID